ncbi:Protein-S-isoprenylcysteine O-methyltransferase Ste14 [Clostridium acidisoli DSM 12555]|uniref:Protein-S-isoprenylcysteine O-methyltransferase Ste14 n=1 Tax=Clostridium acidisoli DSM 12555 TaxID=1121291 RepID=A0A1W1WYK8_9CLOT|nr:isoprenylcysteine carboxylmethyltransferase family protein [Clostridium acidisoli]SMC16650.1 Protein-S-isoprenylcysteine O-methyltransferase Ste14 [Clostridium acidisoli DSM 12555]
MKKYEKVSITKTVLIPIIIMLILSAILFIPAGSLKFFEAWIWLGEFFLMMVYTSIYLFKKNPELLKKRMEFKEKEKMSKIQSLLNLYIIGFSVPGIDYRNHWSNVPTSLVIISNIIVCIGLIIIILVFKENSYASTTIKIENGQYVISTGIYSIVRHPMYLGMLLITLFSPLALGSFWALIPFVFSVPATILRIQNEEKLLFKELLGYREYCLKVKYRVLPFIW